MSNMTVKQAIDGFLLNCKVEGKSHGTIDCYQDKLKGFYWCVSIQEVPDHIIKADQVISGVF